MLKVEERERQKARDRRNEGKEWEPKVFLSSSHFLAKKYTILHLSCCSISDKKLMEKIPFGHSKIA